MNKFSFFQVVAISSHRGGYLKIAHGPLVIGDDHDLGSFNGRIDEVLVTPFDMTQEEVEALYQGDRTYLEQLGFW